MSVELKIKAKHLALEPGIIRKEEQRLSRIARKQRERAQRLEGDGKKQANRQTWCTEAKRWSLEYHRKWDVRNESRATHLARAFLNERKYKSVEAKVHDQDLLEQRIAPRVLKIVNKYGRKKITQEQLAQWFDL